MIKYAVIVIPSFSTRLVETTRVETSAGTGDTVAVGAAGSCVTCGADDTPAVAAAGDVDIGAGAADESGLLLSVGTAVFLFFTVTVQTAFSDGFFTDWTVIFTLPVFLAVTLPFAVTEAIFLLLLRHFNLPFAAFPFALSRKLFPAVIVFLVVLSQRAFLPAWLTDETALN